MLKIFNNKILELFLNNPNTTFHLREIARLTRLSPAGASKILKKLEKENLIIKEKTPLKTDFIANRENKEFISIKKAYNIYSIHNSGLIDYLIEKYKHPEAIILFGSYAIGEDTENSDIDLAILTKQNITLNLTKYEKILKKNINIHEIDLKKIGRELKNNLINGIVLSGYLNIK